ncbi:MAG TPA: response regulator [Blastocatellia bacterium]|nr:response regulator [Blastocatellia bacterium]
MIHLPLSEQAEKSSEQTVSNSQSNGKQDKTSSFKVLVVDDNADAAESLVFFLSLHGHETRVAYSGPETLQVAREFQPQVVLLDIGLPGMDGYEVAQHLRNDSSSKKTILIAITGYGQPEDRERSKAAGFDHHFTKPVDHDKLETLIESLRFD